MGAKQSEGLRTVGEEGEGEFKIWRASFSFSSPSSNVNAGDRAAEGEEQLVMLLRTTVGTVKGTTGCYVVRGNEI